MAWIDTSSGFPISRYAPISEGGASCDSPPLRAFGMQKCTPAVSSLVARQASHRAVTDVLRGLAFRDQKAPWRLLPPHFCLHLPTRDPEGRGTHRFIRPCRRSPDPQTPRPCHALPGLFTFPNTPPTTEDFSIAGRPLRLTTRLPSFRILPGAFTSAGEIPRSTRRSR
jgi:hypothetical protein